jgi:hypothetical protein
VAEFYGPNRKDLTAARLADYDVGIRADFNLRLLLRVLSIRLPFFNVRSALHIWNHGSWLSI